MHLPRSLAVAVAGVVLLVAACGDDDDATTSDGRDTTTRTIEVDMVDIAFEPDTLDVTRGEAVRFVFTNTGAIPHDAFIGDRDAQAEHADEMREAERAGHGDGHGGNEGDDAITVDPGDTGELTYTFDEAGSVEIGCHQSGHYEAGMTIDVTVD
ncbi:MAG: cupredoxin domain-containing protein [Acidimicrobiales bacterium]